MREVLVGVGIFILSVPVAWADEPEPNTWHLIDREDAAGGKTFARAIWADNVENLYLWGIGGNKPARNVYERYELESFDPAKPGWHPAFPKAASNRWTATDYPPFRILGQSGPDGLKYDEGPRLKVVGGYHATNRIQWWDFNGITRPSPIHTFNMACWDSKRKRVLFYSDGHTFALDPETNSWTDLKTTNHPTTCRALAWASLCYDPENDRVVLFGGGLATNPDGAAPTWIYDCSENRWHRPELMTEPPPRCNAPIVYDPTSRCMILFGGYNQAAALNDTWVFDCRTDRWEQRSPRVAPPPMFAPATTSIPGMGHVLVCGNDARRVSLHHQAQTSALKETWAYDVAANQWTPLDKELSLPGVTWLTAAPSSTPGRVHLVAFGPERRTYAFDFDQAKSIESPGASPGTVAWKYPEQKHSLESAPPPDPEAQTRFLHELPSNKFVDAEPPGMLTSKTWSTAVIDTDRSEVIYTGGGHSGYSGNDIARYSLRDNRWSLDMPPRFPPFLEGTNAGIFGWSYGMIPFSQHTYLWYCYDPVSKTVVYLARPSIPDGQEVRRTPDEPVFIYDREQHGYASWVYDSSKKRMHPPSFGRTFANPWHLSLIGTPHGVFAMSDRHLYRGVVERDNGAITWETVDSAFPEPPESIKYHYEYQPLVHDTKRDRLIQLKGDGERVHVYARAIGEDGSWRTLPTEGMAAIGREAVYIPRHDTILWLGDRLFALNLGNNRMRQLDIPLPKGLYNHECAMVYDPKHDVCVALIPSRFSGPMQTFLFRYEP